MSCRIEWSKNATIADAIVADLRSSSNEEEFKNKVKALLKAGYIDLNTGEDIKAPDAESVRVLLTNLVSKNASKDVKEWIKNIKNNLGTIILGPNQLYSGTKFKLNESDRINPIPILSSTINAAFVKSFKADVSMCLVYDHDLGYSDPRTVDKKIIMYLNKKFRLLQNYVGFSGRHPLYNPYSGEFNLDLYEQIMEKFQNQIKIDPITGKFPGELTENNLDQIKAIQAYFILNNFDSLVKMLLPDIKIDIVFDGNTTITNNKYSAIKEGRNSGAFGDDGADASKVVSKPFAQWWLSIKDANDQALTSMDMQKLFEAINTIIDSLKNTDFDFIYTDDNISFENFTDKLVNALNSDSSNSFIKRQLDEDNKGIINSVINALKAAKQNYLLFLNDTTITLVDKAEIEKDRQFIASFKSELDQHGNLAYVSYNIDRSNFKKVSNPGSDIKASNIFRKSKQYIRQLIVKHFEKKFLQDQDYGFYRQGIRLNEGGNIWMDDSFKELVSELTGLQLRDDQYADLFNTNEYAFIKFLEKISGIAQTIQTELLNPYNKNKQLTFNSVLTAELNKLSHDGDYVLITDILVKDNRNKILKIVDSNNNQQAILGLTNTAQKLRENVYTFSKQANNGGIYNLYIKCPEIFKIDLNISKDKLGDYSFINPMVYRLDILIYDNKGNRIVKKASKFNANESAYVSFGFDFFDSYLKNDGVTYWQLDCYSDKVRIPLMAMSLTSSSKELGDRSLVDLSTKEIYNLYIDNVKGYLSDLQSKTTSKYKALLPILNKTVGVPANFTLNSFADIARLFELKGVDGKAVVTYNALREALKEYNSTSESPIELVEQIDYIKSKNSLKFNNSLLIREKSLLLGDSKFFMDYYIAGLDSFKSNFSSIKIPNQFTNDEFKEQLKDNSFKKKLIKLFGEDTFSGYKSNEILAALQEFFAKDATWIGHTVNGSNQDLIMKMEDLLIKRYYALLALLSEACWQTSLKDYTGHKGIADQKHISELDNMSESQLMQHFNSDVSKRLGVSKKRGNAEVSSYMARNTMMRYGLRKTSTIAVVESKTETVMNYDGKTHDQEVDDGTIHTLGIFTFWEDHSYPGHTYDATKKVIGILPQFESMRQIKCASYSLDNILIHNSFRASSEQNLNIKNRAINLMKTGIINNEVFFNALSALKAKEQQIGIDYYTRIDGKYYHIIDIDVIDSIDGNGKTILLIDNNGETHTYNDGRSIQNVYDLWEALGAELSYHKDNLDEYRVDNSTMDIAAILISECQPDIKESMTSVIVDVTCMKSGITNVNKMEDLDRAYGDNEKLKILTSKWDNTRWGIQLDYSHESDDSKIPYLTQLMSNVSLNGKNSKKVHDMLATLGVLLQKSTESLNKKYGINLNNPNATNLHRTMAERFMQSIMKSGGDRTTAITAAKQVLEAHAKELFGKYNAQLAYSDPDIFYKMASDFISSLNETSIRGKFDGIAIILNPSHSIYAVYEDINGDVYKADDIIRMAEKLGLNPDAESIESLITKIVDNNGNLLFSDIKITPDEVAKLELLDTVIINQDGIEREEIINSVDKLREIADGILEEDYTVRIKRSAQRNLKSPSITFNEKGTTKSMWLLDCTRSRSVSEKALADAKKAVVEAKSILNSNIHSNIPSNNISLLADTLAKAQNTLQEALMTHAITTEWYRACYKGLGEKNNKKYYYASLEDYYKNKKTYVTNVIYKQGELILPRVYKSKLGLGEASLSEIRRKGPEFFKDQIIKRNEGSRVLNAITDKDSIDARIVVDGATINYYHKDNLTHTKDYRVKNNLIQTRLLEIDNILWYTDTKGNALFPVPNKNIIINEFKDGNHIVYEVASAEENLMPTKAYYALNEEHLIFDIEFNSNYKEEIATTTDKDGKEKQSFTKRASSLYNLEKQLGADANVDTRASEMYNAFLASLDAVSVRIPTQSFLSFMTNKTVAFTDNDSNNGYINLMQIWFTGGDYDIDKSYTMMYSLDKKGNLAVTSPLIDTRYKETIDEGFDLPLPDSKKLITIVSNKEKANTDFKQLLENAAKESGFFALDNDGEFVIDAEVKTGEELILYINDSNSSDGDVIKTPNGYYAILEESDVKSAIPLGYYFSKFLSGLDNTTIDKTTSLMMLKGYKSLLNNLDTKNKIFIDENNKLYTNLKEVIRKLDLHNNYEVSVTAIKNKVVNTIMLCSGDILNLEASQQPMTSDEFVALIDECEEENPELKDNIIYNATNPYHKWQIQELASIGKGDVGIAANGIKVGAAIQQYYDDFYRSWNGSKKNLDLRHTVDIPLVINSNGKNIITDRIVKMGDTILDEDPEKAFLKFKVLYETAYGKTENELLEELKKTTISLTVFNYLNHPTSPLTMNLRIIVSHFFTWQFKRKKQNKSIDIANNIDDYLDFLLYHQSFNANVADTLSVFISLAVDNMKELALARINGNLDLLKLPIAMVIMGVDTPTVIKVCKEILTPIAKKMNANTMNGDFKPSLEKAIESIYGKDIETKSSLYRICAFADTITTVSSFFKINLGVQARYNELMAFNYKLANSKSKMKTIKDGIYTEVLDKNEITKGNLKLDLLFDINLSDDSLQYKELLLDLYDKHKVGINIIDLILSNDNFRSQLEAEQNQLKNIKAISGLAYFTEVALDALNAISKDFVESDFKNIARLYQDFIIAKTLHKLNISFDNKRLQQTFKGFKNNTVDGNLWGLSNEEGVKQFIDLMNNYIIPNLKLKYKDNYFIDKLEGAIDYSNGRGDRLKYDIKINLFDDTETVSLEDNERAIVDFTAISDLTSGIVLADGYNLSIGDAFLLYNMIVNKGKMCSLKNAVMAAATHNKSSILRVYKETMIDYDDAVLNRENKNADHELLDELQKLKNNFVLVSAALNEERIGVDTIAEESIDIKDNYLWNYAQPVYTMSIEDIRIKYSDTINKIEINKLYTNDKYITYDFYGVNGTYISKSFWKSNDEIGDPIIPKNVIIDILLKLQANESTTLILDGIFEVVDKTFFDAKLKNQFNSSATEKAIKTIFESLPDNIEIQKCTIQNSNIFNTSDEIYLKEEKDKKVIVINELAIIATKADKVIDVLLNAITDNASNDVKITKLNEILEKSSTATVTKNNIISSYIDYLTNNFIGKRELEMASRALTQASEKIELLEHFYEPVTDKKTAKLDVYDLVTITTDKDHNTYLYAGSINEEDIFISITGNDIKKVTKDLVLRIVKVQLKLLVDPYFLIPVIAYNDPIIKNNIVKYEELILNPKDRVLIGKEWYHVITPVYKFDNNILLSSLVIVVNSNGEYNTFNASDILLVSLNKQLLDGKILSTIEFNKELSDYSELRLFLRKGVKVTLNVKGQEIITDFISYITNGTILTSDNKIYNLNDIIKVESGFNAPMNKRLQILNSPLVINYKTKTEAEEITTRLQRLSILQNWNIENEPIAKQFKFKLANSNLPVKTYRMNGYTKVLYNTGFAINDIFDNGNLIAFISDIQNDVYEVLIYKTEITGEHIWERRYIKDINELNNLGQHFTANKDLQNKELIAYTLESGRFNKLNIKLNLNATFDNWIYALEKLTGMKVVRVQSNNVNRNAWVENNVIFLNDTADLNYALHELTHIAIANMRSNYKEAYIDMRDSFKLMLEHIEELSDDIKSILMSLKEEFHGIDISDDYYNDLDKLEEKLIRFLDATRCLVSGKNFDYEKAMNDAFSKLFNADSMVIDSNVSLRNFLQNTNYAHSLVTSPDFLKLHRETKIKKLMNDIKKQCK